MLRTSRRQRREAMPSGKAPTANKLATMLVDPPAADPKSTAKVRPWLLWTVRIVALAGLVVVAWACLSSWGAVVHGHPAYAVLLVVTVLLCALAIVRSLRARMIRSGFRLVLRTIVVVLAVAGIALVAWLRPFSAEEPALAAMQSSSTVTVIETPTRIELTPAATPNTTAVFFEPGAKVEARAYAAILRPLAEAGFTLTREETFLPYQYFLIFQHGAAKTPASP